MCVFVFSVDFTKLQMSTLSIRVSTNWISTFIRIFIILFSQFRRRWFFKRRRQRFQLSTFWSFVKHIRNIVLCERDVDRNKIEKMRSWQNWSCTNTSNRCFEIFVFDYVDAFDHVDVFNVVVMNDDEIQSFERTKIWWNSIFFEYLWW